MNRNFNFVVDGMTCPNCEMRITNALLGVNGVVAVNSSYKNALLLVETNTDTVDAKIIAGVLMPLGYTVNDVPQKPKAKWRGLVAIVALIAVVVLVIMLVRGQFNVSLDILQAGTAVGYGVLFVVGLVNSMHCAAMCGGINLSLCASYKPNSTGKAAKIMPSILYNAGRLVSYTVIGGIVGAIGSVINISPNIRGVASIIAGLFMLIMGFAMLDIPFMRKLTPKMPKIFGKKLYKRLGTAAPFTVGLLNGLLPCGPLQSVQLYALGTGSFFTGAISMFMFALGTVPLMFGLGAAGGLLSQKATRNMMKIGAVLVAVLGLFMLFMGIMNATR